MVRVVFKSIATNEEDIVQEGRSSVIFVQINVGHHRAQIHWVLDDVIIIWHLGKKVSDMRLRRQKELKTRVCYILAKAKQLKKKMT